MVNWFKKLGINLKKSSNKITEGVAAIIAKQHLDNNILEDLHDLLISVDLGNQTAKELIKQLADNKFEKKVSVREVKDYLAQIIINKIENFAIPLTIDPDKKPHIILITGVNGGGKTSTIGKLAHRFVNENKKVRIVAADTFRAAAVAQLNIWANKAQVPIFTGNNNKNIDAAGLIYDAIKFSQQNADDVLLIDTAGRLQNKTNLMQELEKIHRVIKKIDNEAPHSCVLVLDATIGQNTYSQTELFNKSINISGIIMTKMDSTSKGGVLVGIIDKYKLPILAIGSGEKITDLNDFDAQEYVQSLLDL